MLLARLGWAGVALSGVGMFLLVFGIQQGHKYHWNAWVLTSIIGGLVVKLGSRMVDSSLRTKLNSIKHAMKEAG